MSTQSIENSDNISDQMEKIVVATDNVNKLREISHYLVELDLELILKPKEIVIEEVGKTFAENAVLKASQVAKALNQWAIADDSGLMVDALDGAPGLYSARYAPTDPERIHRLLTEMSHSNNRQAKFICAIAFSRPDGSIAFQSEGICEGEILHTPRGSDGFGYDPVFYVPQEQQTFAQMPSALKNRISHRGKAFSKLLLHLQQDGNPR